MASLTYEVFQQCSDSGFHQIQPYQQTFNSRLGFICSCPGFKFRKTCKHVKELESKRCGWHGAYDELQSEEQEKNKTCPRCGGKTEFVRVGV